ncbi:MATE family efflux transporter [Streptomyces sp. NPDC004286]|uniref:MATE family efflux transporter n=1 Tax=Streptomyces sp. NPDC004286 TaxID=3364696 RepID=UPI003690997B
MLPGEGPRYGAVPAGGQDDFVHGALLAATALPLYLTMAASSAGALVDAALLGRHATSSLAAFAVTIAVYSPASATVTGALRGVMPFVSQHEDDPARMAPLVRDGMWLGFIVGLLGALAVARVSVIGRATGVPESTLDHLGVFRYLLAVAVLSTSVGASAISVLVALGQGKLVMRAGLVGTVVTAARRSVMAGGGVALCGVATLGLLVVLGHWIVPLFSDDAALRPQLEHQLLLVCAVVVTDALQAITGFGMLGLKRTVPSLVSTGVFFGLLCVSAVPVSYAGGLTALWSALVCANLLQAVTKVVIFHRYSARLATERPSLAA